MKKGIARITLFCFLMMLFAVTAFAAPKVSTKELTFGNLYIYMPFKSVIKMYGKPVKVENPYMPRPIYAWSNGLRVRPFMTSKGPYVDYFSFSGSDTKNFVTPRGIHVGSTEDELVRAYGFDKYQMTKGTVYFVVGRDGYRMSFWIDKETRKVTSMSVDENK